MKKSIIAVAGLALAASAANADVTIDLTGIQFDAATGFGFTVPGDGLNVVGMDWDINYTAGDAVGNASWLSELRIVVTAPGGTADNDGTADGDADGSVVLGGDGGDVIFGWGDTSGSDSASGSNGMLAGWNTTGNVEIWIFDTFDDSGDDGLFGRSSITLRTVPAPASLALLGLGGVFAGRRRR